MKPIVFPRPKTIDELKDKYTAPENGRRIDSRGRVRILVIDDQAFAPQVNLANHGFSLTCVTDISSIKQVEAYPIILCDLQGVGLLLSKTLQGAQIIKEIRKSFPEKVVLAYTGGSANAGVTRAGLDEAHFFLRKDERIETWVEKLDDAIGMVTNPIRVWKSTRIALLEAGATPYSLMMLEDAFVASYGKPQEVVVSRLKVTMNNLKLVPSTKAVVENLIASVVLKLTLGL